MQVGSKLGHKVMSLASVPKFATLPWNVLLSLSVSIVFVYSSARVTSVKSAKPISLSEDEETGSEGLKVYQG